MKKTINYEKDILFKTSIYEICSISLEHDFTVDNGELKGDFIISGEYKMNELSVNKEPFKYRLPLAYELESNVDLDTLSYDIENFEYNTKDDELSVYIDFGVRYEEKEAEPIIPEITEDVINLSEDASFSINTPEPTEDAILMEAELPRLKEEDESVVMSNEQDEFVTYHVHIVRDGDTYENIAKKYGVKEDVIKEYNGSSALELKAKIIIPYAE